MRPFSHARLGLFGGLLCQILITAPSMAQLPTSVDIDLADNPSADSLEVRVRANGSGFFDLLTGLTFTLRWTDTSPAVLAGRTLNCPTGVPIGPSAVITAGGYHYKTYNAFGLSPIADECPGQVWPADVWITVMKVRVTGLNACTAFNIVNDAWTTANNRNLFISLNGYDLTGSIEATPDSVGSCAADCNGIVGGAALPGSTCDDNDVCTTNDLWSVACACAGTFADLDADGTCDANDGCPADPNKTVPGACGCGIVDTDTDGDATADCLDGCPADANKTSPGTCGCGTPDTDTDGDGAADCNDFCPEDPTKVLPGACGCGVADIDSDGDGTADCLDSCPSDPLKTAPGICGCGIIDTDSDGDGTADCDDGCPNDPLKIFPGVCGCDVPEVDGDNDGTPDCTDGCPNDPDKTAPGLCGCGVADTDGDADGTPDCNDGCPNDPGKVVAGTCGCGNPEPGAGCNDGNTQSINDQIQGDCSCAGTLVDCNDNEPCTADTYDGTQCVHTPLPDTDGDGSCDLIDGCPNDPNKTTPGICGCDVSDADSDGDATPDCTDGCPNDPDKIAPGICGCDVPDSDADGDATADCVDGCPADPLKIAPGTCGCGVLDSDSDADGVVDCIDDCPLLTGQIGSPCDDGDPFTIFDAINDQCVCVGAPGNDGCFDATSIAVNPPADCPANAIAGSNTWATPDAGNTLCDLDGFLNDVWYTFNSGDNTTVTIALDPGTMVSWGIGIYAECGHTELFCTSSPTAPFDFPVDPNTPYIIRVYSPVWFGGGGDFTLCVSAGIHLGVKPVNTPHWSVFPNPNAGTFQVVNTGADADARLELIDLAGRMIYVRDAHFALRDPFTVNGGFAAGIYTLRVVAGNDRFEQRVVVE